MKYLTIATGALLTILGIAAFWQGYDIVQMERGWSFVIAGATVFTGGIVTMAIGVLIGAVQSLRESALPDRAERPRADPGKISAPSLSRAPEIAGGVGAAAAAVISSAPTAAPALMATREPPAVAPEIVAPEAPAATLHETKQSAENDIHDELQPPNFGASPPQTSASHEIAGEDARAWIKGAFAETSDNDPALDWLRQAPRKATPGEPSQSDVTANVEPIKQAKPQIALRRFESNGVSYTLYADGSIDSEAPDGRFHFASMDELKTHLARKDGAEPATSQDA